MSNNRWQMCLVIMGLLVSLIILNSAMAQSEKTRIKGLASQLGQTGYFEVFAMADIINKHSTWLKADAVETTGPIENVRTIIENPKIRKESFLRADPFTAHQASIGAPPFTGKYNDLKAIALSALNGTFWVTLNKNIKTLDDFVGKRVGTFTKGGQGSVATDLIFKYGTGTFDKIKFEYIGMNHCKDALMDGKIDVAIGGCAYVGKGYWSAAPAFNELWAEKREFILLGVPSDVIKLVQKRSGYPMFTDTIPAGNFGPRQPNAVDSFSFRNGFWADKELDEKIVYEMCRLMWKYSEDFKTYNQALGGITKDTIPQAAFEEKDYHPGAVKFFKEQGAKIGIK